MSAKPHLSLEIRAAIVAKYESGISATKIAETYKINRKTVYNLLKKKSNSGSLQDAYKKGRNRRTTEKEDRRIIRLFKETPGLSPLALSKTEDFCVNFGISDRTIRRRLRAANLKTYVLRKSPSISEKNKKLRLEFARKYKNAPNDFWKQVLFTDESPFSIQGTYGKKFVRMEPKTIKKIRPTLPTQRHSGGTIMFWGCMCINGVGDLVEIKGNMNQAVYIELLNETAFACGDLLIGTSFVLQHDNAPCHKGRNVTSFLNGVGQKVLEWPPQSPDLNVIEHVWAYLKQKRSKSLTQTRLEAVENIRSLWNDIPMEFLINLVESMPRRLQAVIDAKGGNTKY